MVYVGSGDRALYALDAVTGRPVWRFETGGPIYAKALISGQTVYVCSNDGNLYALDIKSGAKTWQLELGANGSLAARDDMLFVGLSDGRLIALESSK